MKRDNKKVIYWLFIGCALIFIMVVVGGITRLTHSGLSMPSANHFILIGSTNTGQMNMEIHSSVKQFLQLMINNGRKHLSSINNIQNIKN